MLPPEVIAPSARTLGGGGATSLLEQWRERQVGNGRTAVDLDSVAEQGAVDVHVLADLHGALGAENRADEVRLPPDSTRSRARLRKNDLLLRFDQEESRSSWCLSALVVTRAPGPFVSADLPQLGGVDGGLPGVEHGVAVLGCPVWFEDTAGAPGAFELGRVLPHADGEAG